jgi:hypothetical protein
MVATATSRPQASKAKQMGAARLIWPTEVALPLLSGGAVSGIGRERSDRKGKGVHTTMPAPAEKNGDAVGSSRGKKEKTMHFLTFNHMARALPLLLVAAVLAGPAEAQETPLQPGGWAGLINKYNETNVNLSGSSCLRPDVCVSDPNLSLIYALKLLDDNARVRSETLIRALTGPAAAPTSLSSVAQQIVVVNQSLGSVNGSIMMLHSTLQNAIAALQTGLDRKLGFVAARAHCEATLSAWNSYVPPPERASVGPVPNPKAWQAKDGILGRTFQVGWGLEVGGAYTVKRVGNDEALALSINGPECTAGCKGMMTGPETLEYEGPKGEAISGSIKANGHLVIWSDGTYWIANDKGVGASLSALPVSDLGDTLNGLSVPDAARFKVYRSVAGKTSFCALPAQQPNPVHLIYTQREMETSDRDKSALVSKVTIGESTLPVLAGTRDNERALALFQGNLLLWEKGAYSLAR